jgi:hypothetical protein
MPKPVAIPLLQFVCRREHLDPETDGARSRKAGEFGAGPDGGARDAAHADLLVICRAEEHQRSVRAADASRARLILLSRKSLHRRQIRAWSDAMAVW